MHSTPASTGLLQQLEVRPLGVDDLAAARYVMSGAFLAKARGHYRDAEIAAYLDFVRSPLYADLLLGNKAYAAWVGSEMVGVGAWRAGEDKSPTARVLAVFVNPLFGGAGIAGRLVEYLERDARAAGYRALEAHVTLNAVEYFERSGYVRIHDGALRLPAAGEMPIVIMRKTVGGERSEPIH